MRRSVAMVKAEVVKPELAIVQRTIVPLAEMRRPEPAGLASWILRSWKGRATRPREQKRLRVLEQVSLGNKQQLALVECDGQQFLVGSGEHGVQAMMPVRKAD